MPDYWTKRDERQYKEVLGSLKGNPRAKEIAARTVNKWRGEHGKTKDKEPKK